MVNWDWAAAETEVQRALAIDPTNPAALMAAGQLSMTLGRWDDAERQLRSALARDPLNYEMWNLGTTYYLAGRFEDAEVMSEFRSRRGCYEASGLWRQAGAALQGQQN